MIAQVCQQTQSISPKHVHRSIRSSGHFVPAPYLHFAAVLKPGQLLRCGDRANQTKLINQNSDLNFETMNPFLVSHNIDEWGGLWACQEEAPPPLPQYQANLTPFPWSFYISVFTRAWLDQHIWTFSQADYTSSIFLTPSLLSIVEDFFWNKTVEGCRLEIVHELGSDADVEE